MRQRMHAREGRGDALESGRRPILMSERGNRDLSDRMHP